MDDRLAPKLLRDINQLRTSVHFLLTYVHDVMMMQPRDDCGLREHMGKIVRLPLAEIGRVIQRFEGSTETWIRDLLVDQQQIQKLPIGLPTGAAVPPILALQDRLVARVDLLHRVLVIGGHYAATASPVIPSVLSGSLNEGADRLVLRKFFLAETFARAEKIKRLLELAKGIPAQEPEWRFLPDWWVSIRDELYQVARDTAYLLNELFDLPIEVWAAAGKLPGDPVTFADRPDWPTEFIELRCVIRRLQEPAINLVAQVISSENPAAAISQRGEDLLAAREAYLGLVSHLATISNRQPPVPKEVESLPPSQQAVGEGDDSGASQAATNTMPAPKARRCESRNALFLKWHREIGPGSANVFGKIRDRWNELSDTERKQHSPCDTKLPKGKSGYDTVRKAIELAEPKGRIA